METKGIETTKSNAGPEASQETQVSKPKSGQFGDSLWQLNKHCSESNLSYLLGVWFCVVPVSN